MDKKERLEKHIKALEKGYDNLLLILNQDLEKNEDNQVKLKDTAKEEYAKGVLKVAHTSNEVLAMINKANIDLAAISGEENLVEEIKKEEEAEEFNEEYPTQKHLK